MRHRFPLVLLLLWASPAAAFCGFYVASGNAKLFNHSSQVVVSRDGDRTVMTMVPDYAGDAARFAMVVPVPTVLERGQIHVGDSATVARLDAWSAPRLVEYWDEDPCASVTASRFIDTRSSTTKQSLSVEAVRELAVVVARYEVEEYDVVLLSSPSGEGVERWLVANHYSVPPGAAHGLETYAKQGMKFFVAKIDLSRRAHAGITTLRPLQIAYESAKFMIPVRLGMANADGPQELFVYAITRSGRVEATNYRNVRLPSNAQVPEYVKTDFPRFHRAVFQHAAEHEGLGVVFTEYAWNAATCDPCAAPPLAAGDLRSLGAAWMPAQGWAQGGAFVTRLHVRYDRTSFPEDLTLQVTQDSQPFQGRYVLRHEWRGDEECPELAAYRDSVRERRRSDAETLANLTGWSPSEIRTAIGADANWATAADRRRWWDRLWSR